MLNPPSPILYSSHFIDTSPFKYNPLLQADKSVLEFDTEKALLVSLVSLTSPRKDALRGFLNFASSPYSLKNKDSWTMKVGLATVILLNTTDPKP